MIPLYYKFISLPNNVKENHSVKSKERLDCVLFADNTENGYKGLTEFVNPKGMLFLYKREARNIIEADSKRIAQWTLSNNSLNFTSIFLDDLDFPNIGYGYPNARPFLSNGNTNPLFRYKNDGYLFLTNLDYTEIEILVIPDARNLIRYYYQKMIDGGFDDEVENLRKAAKNYYPYEGLIL